jgi:hypothetical protein
MQLTTTQAAQAVAAAQASGAAGSAATGALSAGSSAAAAIPIVGWIVAGMQAANGFRKEGFDPNNGTTNALGKMVGAVPLALNSLLQKVGVGGALANILTGASINTKLFGRANPKVESAGIRGTVGDDGVSGNTYQNIIEKGGWFRSDKRYTNQQALAPDLVNTFTNGFDSIKVVSIAFAKSLGEGGQALDGFKKSFDIAFGSDEQKNQEAVGKFFTDLGDEFANRLVPNLGQFAMQGETASKTLERLSSEFTATNNVANILGKTVEQVFGSAGLGSAKVREMLLNLAGGADALTNKTAAYVSAIYDDAQKLAPVQKALADAFKELNVAMPTSKAGFKALVDSLDLTNAAQASLFNSLLDLAPIFGQVSDAADQLSNAVDTVGAAYDKAVTNAENAYSKLEKAVNDQAKLLTVDAKARLDIATKNVAAIKSVFDAITSAIASTKVESTALDIARRKSAQALISNAANSGADVTKVAGLSNALKDISKPSEKFFSTFAEYAFDQAKTADDLNKLQSNASSQLDLAQLTVDRLNDILDAIQTNADKTLQDAKGQLDVLKGIDTTVLSVDQAISAFATSISALTTALANKNAPPPVPPPIPAYVPPPDPTEEMVKGLYRQYLGREGEEGGVAGWVRLAKSGWSVEQLSNGFMSSDEYKGLHPFAVGTNYVPYDMPAMVHEGERIIPKSDNAELMRRLDSGPSGNMSSADVVAAISRLDESIKAGDLATVQKLTEMLKINRKWDGEGIPETRDVAA